MSASEFVTENKFVLSPGDFPGLPGAVPKVVENIDTMIQALIFSTQTVGNDQVKVSDLRGLQNQVLQLKELYTTLHHAAAEVTKATGPLFEQRKDSSAPKKTSREENRARREAKEKIQELNRLVEAHTSSEVSHPEISVTPNFLPRVEGLSAELKELSGSLQTVMSDALDPEKRTDVGKLKAQLQTHRSQFEDLGAQAGNLKEPVSQRADALDKFIEDTREHMATIWISKAVCDWQLARIDIFTNCYSHLEALQQTMAGVTQDNENLKTFLRENPFKPVDLIKLKFEKIMQEPGDKTIKDIGSDITTLLDQYPETASDAPKEVLRELLKGKPETKVSDAKGQIQAVLGKLPQSPVDEAKRQFESLRRRYNECKARAEEYRAGAEKAIKDLEGMIEKAEKKLISSIEEIPFHDEKVQGSVIKQMKSSISEIQGQRETLLYKLKELWKQVHDQFTSDTKEHLFYEINREGYAIFEYGGNVPRDTTYGIFWSVSNRYVTAMTVDEK